MTNSNDPTNDETYVYMQTAEELDINLAYQHPEP